MTATSLSLKPWAPHDAEQLPLSDVLARVSYERGHFRDITEASLAEEIAAEGTSSPEPSDEDDDNGGAVPDEENAKGRKPPTTRQELYAARHELLQRVNEAHQDMMLSLDFMSLLQSASARAAASTTISPFLKQNVPLGSLGADVWHRMPVNTERTAQESIMAYTVRMKYLQESADDLLSAATRLEDNVRKETRFWEQMLAVSERGWNVSQIPGQRQRLLGVHFGFRGSAPEFLRRNIAALIADAEGNISLERGIGSKPKAVRAVMKKGNQRVGSSRLPPVLDETETTLEARIRHARDSLYDEELYHEMIREARTLTSMGVVMRGTAISFATSASDSALRVELELVSLENDHSLPVDASEECDHIANAIVLAARLLLGQAHRDKVLKKSQTPPPMVVKTERTEPLPILKPLVLLLKHHAAVHQLHSCFTQITTLLKAAGIAASCTHPSMQLPVCTDGEGINVESLISALLKPLVAEGSIKLDSTSPPLKLAVVTASAISSGSAFAITTFGGVRHELPTMEDLLAAANDFVGLAVAEDLFVKIGMGWEFDRRCGLLSRPAAADDDAMGHGKILIKGELGELRLLLGKKEVIWKANGSEKRSLQEAWQELVA